MATMKNKPVSFNIDNPEDIKLLKHVEGKNFSGYVKSLISKDLKKKTDVHRTPDGVIKISVE